MGIAEQKSKNNNTDRRLKNIQETDSRFKSSR